MVDERSPEGNLGERFYEKAHLLKGIRMRLEHGNIY